jgi:uncharacterized membrane protein
MEKKKYTILGIIITAMIGFVCGWAVTHGDFILPVIAIIVGLLVLNTLKRRVKVIIEDERIYKISQEASRRTVQVIGVLFSTLGLVILGLSRSGYLNLEEIGYSLAYFAATLLVVYMTFYIYYGKKYGM